MIRRWTLIVSSHSCSRPVARPLRLLLDGSGPATPAEYSLPGHVDAQLVADLAAWITGS